MRHHQGQSRAVGPHEISLHHAGELARQPDVVRRPAVDEQRALVADQQIEKVGLVVDAGALPDGDGRLVDGLRLRALRARSAIFRAGVPVHFQGDLRVRHRRGEQHRH
jgi:hypothetical protein